MTAAAVKTNELVQLHFKNTRTGGRILGGLLRGWTSQY